MKADRPNRGCRFEWLRPTEIVDEMRRRPLVYLPLGPLEYHGHHLPLGTDTLEAQEVALRVADKTGGVVLPPFFCGTDAVSSPQLLRDLGLEGDEYIVGMDLPSNVLNSLYFPEEFVAVLVRVLLEALVRQGYRLIVVVNGHGGVNHIALLNRLSAEFTARGPARVLNFVAWSSVGDVPQTELEEGTHVQEVGHADTIETARMMALDPEAVDLSTLPPLPEPLSNVDWAVVDYLTFRGEPTADHTVRESHDPRIGASPERGEETYEQSASYIAQRVTEALQEMGYSPRTP